MFFPKLRRRAKWVFLFLAIAFAFSFVFFGVGAGGSGIGDFLSDFLNDEPATGAPSLDDAQKAVAENPNDPQAQLDLARAAQAEGDVQLAVSAFEQYRTMKPKDADALRSLAALYGRQIADAQQRAAIASNAAAEASLPNTLAPQDSQLLQEITQNRLTQAVSARAEARASTANSEVQRLFDQPAQRLRGAHAPRQGRPARLAPVRQRGGDRPELRDGDHRVRGVPQISSRTARRPSRSRSGSTR